MNVHEIAIVETTNKLFVYKKVKAETFDETTRETLLLVLFSKTADSN